MEGPVSARGPLTLLQSPGARSTPVDNSGDTFGDCAALPVEIAVENLIGADQEGGDAFSGCQIPSAM